MVASADDSPTTFLVVDSPTDGVISGTQVVLGGWALSTESQAGTGIDRVQVYIDGPAETGVPLGQATYGLLRQDVAVARGDSRFAPSGWSLHADLAPGLRRLFIYGHLAERGDAEGWIGPTEVVLRVDGGTGSGVQNARSLVRDATGPTTNRLSDSAGCLVPDPDSGRCRLRSPNAASSPNSPTASVIPGSWLATPSGVSGQPPVGDPDSPPRSGGPRTQGNQSQSGPSQSGPSQSGMTNGSSSRSGDNTSNTSTNTLSAPGGRQRGGGAVGGDGVLPSLASVGSGQFGAGQAPAITLSATQVGGNQVQLNWSQVGQGAAAYYEIRSCPAFSSATFECRIVGNAQAGGSFRLPSASGVYMVRAIGPLGQFHAESNRVQVCCGGTRVAGGE
jgi:hypothetical protein